MKYVDKERICDGITKLNTFSLHLQQCKRYEQNHHIEFYQDNCVVGVLKSFHECSSRKEHALGTIEQQVVESLTKHFDNFTQNDE